MVQIRNKLYPMIQLFINGKFPRAKAELSGRTKKENRVNFKCVFDI